MEGREVEPEDQVGEVRLEVVDGDAPSLLEQASQRQDERKEKGEYHHHSSLSLQKKSMKLSCTIVGHMAGSTPSGQ